MTVLRIRYVTALRRSSELLVIIGNSLICVRSSFTNQWGWLNDSIASDRGVCLFIRFLKIILIIGIR